MNLDMQFDRRKVIFQLHFTNHVNWQVIPFTAAISGSGI